MSDVDDWTGVSAGATSVIASGTVVGQTVSGVKHMIVDVANIPSTTRSLLLLVLPTVVSGGTTAYALAAAKAQTTKQVWQPIGATDGWPNLSGTATPIAGDAMAPLYFPAYGVTDTEMVIDWEVLGSNGDDEAEYWVLALPDTDLNGSTYLGMTVTNPLSYLTASAVPLVVEGAPGGATLPVELFDGSGNPLGTDTNGLRTAAVDPRPTTPHTLFTSLKGNGSGTLLAAPSAGQVYEVMGASIYGGPASAAATVRIFGTTSGGILVAAQVASGGLSNANMTGPVLVDEGLSYSNTSGVNQNLTVIYRTLTLV